MDESAEQWLMDLASGDEATVIRALHQACPCTGSPLLYERYKHQLHALKKDPRPEVRKVALHLEVDALDQLRVHDEQANGFFRNRAGGWGRERELRRADLRQGVREPRRPNHRERRSTG